MRIQLLSDLHLERAPDWQPPRLPDIDVLVVAGDVGSYQAGSELAGDDFGLARFSPRAPGASWKRTLYLPGNHEFDSLDYDATYARLRGLCAALGIEWLEKETIVAGGVRFVGATLWADFDALASSQASLGAQLKAREKAFRAANFYLGKYTTLKDGAPVLAEGWRAMSLADQDWLRAALGRPFAGPTVAVTHFAPSLRSADPRYGLVPGTAGFCNAMDDFLPLADFWLHGHLHCANDYLASGTRPDGTPWSCRVVANPLGYLKRGEQEDFRPDLVIEIPSR
ncbi:MAG TPA: metallophosphoesterase [Burkholderiaceae bacterium]